MRVLMPYLEGRGCGKLEEGEGGREEMGVY